MSEQGDIAGRLTKIANALVFGGICEACKAGADEIARLRAQLASATREIADAKDNARHLSGAAEAAFRDRDYYSAKLESTRKALQRVTIFRVEDDNRIHVRICGEELLPANPGTSLARALLEFDSIQTALTDETGK
jgi:hypothetical protein